MNLQIDEYIAQQYEWTSQTKRTATKHLGYLAKWLKDRVLDDVTIVDFEAWTDERKWGDSTRHGSLWTFKAYLKWAGLEHPLLAHKVKRRLAPPGKYLTQADVLELLRQCHMMRIGGDNFSLVSVQGVRDYAVVAFLWSTWARASELCGTQRKHLDPERQEVMFRVKGGGHRVATFDQDTQAALGEWLELRAGVARPTAGGLFVSVMTGHDLSYPALWHLLKRLGERAGVSAPPHAFRRGAARNWVQNGGEDRLGMIRGGWRSFPVYGRYTELASLERFKKERWITQGKSTEEAISLPSRQVGLLACE